MHEGRALKDKMEAGKICLGAWNSFCDPCVTELLCGSGFDFLMIDAEHGPLGIEMIQLMCMATKGTDTSPIVRPEWNDPVLIKRVLDVGAAGILAPMVRNAEEGRLAVAACKYPPAGIRGFGPRRPSAYGRHPAAEYIKAANEDLVIWLQIEHIDGVNNIEEIVAVPGVCGIFIGFNDLSGSMGMLGQTEHPEVLAARDTVMKAAQKAGLPVGFGAGPDSKEIRELVARGLQFITVADDGDFLAEASQASVAGMREALKA